MHDKATAVQEQPQNLIVALELASADIPTFPAGLDKRPLVASDWHNAASTDPVQLQRWWRAHPNALPAIPLGRIDAIVIDCDRHDGGADGVAAYAQLVKAHEGSKVPAIPIVSTPSGGLHFYYRQPAGEPLGNRRGELPNGIDVRGHGGYVIAPGSRRPDGSAWTPIAGKPSVTDLVKHGATMILPEWQQRMIRPPSE